MGTHLSCSCVVALDQSLDRLNPNLSPSELVHSPDKVAELLGGDKTLIHLSGAPAALFNPALARLQRNLENLEQVAVSVYVPPNTSDAQTNFTRMRRSWS